jgi:hypothetical protein
MHGQKTFIILFICLLIGEFAMAQHGKSTYTRSRHNFTAPRVRGMKAKIICPIFETSKYPYHGLGFKMGDPFALTYKFYPNDKFSFAADFGKAASGLYSRYYREKFNEYTNSDTVPEGSFFSYLTHKVKSDFIGEAKVLYHINVKKITPGLQLYVGAGWAWKRATIQFDYLYDRGNNLNEFGRFQRSRSTMGPQIVLGIEYAYFKIPISAFMELEHFTDVQADPGWQRFQGGVGLRYIF